MTVAKRIEIGAQTERGTVLPGVLFREGKRTRTAVIAITGIHGNFWSNPFYYDFGDALARAGHDFVYAETCDAQGQLEVPNANTGGTDAIGSFCEDFAWIDEDVDAYVRWARREGYEGVVLCGHSLGANKVVHYLSGHHDSFVEHFVLLSPANMDFLLGQVTEDQRKVVDRACRSGQSDRLLPFAVFGWAPMLAGTARQWLHANPLDNVHTDPARDFSQARAVTQAGALLIGTRDAFALGDPEALVRVTSAAFPKAGDNQIILIEGTGHTYQRRVPETTQALVGLVRGWDAQHAGHTEGL